MSEIVTAESKAATRRIPASVRHEVLSSGPCAYCGDLFSEVVDHVLPVSRGGSGAQENLAPACTNCNEQKGDYTPEEWKAWRLAEGLSWPPQSRTQLIREEMEKAAERQGRTVDQLASEWLAGQREALELRRELFGEVA